MDDSFKAAVASLVTRFEPKRDFRWLFRADGIEPFLMRSVTRPCYHLGPDGVRGFDPLRIELFDAEEPNVVPTIVEWSADRKPREGSIQQLDAMGTVIEMWEIHGMRPVRVDFGEMSYSSEDLCKVRLELEYDGFTYGIQSLGDWTIRIVGGE